MNVEMADLKARLSEHVDRAAKGEIIRVTEGGRVKAVLGPVPDRAPVERGIREGWLTSGSGELPVRTWRRFKAARSVQEMLADERGH